MPRFPVRSRSTDCRPADSSGRSPLPSRRDRPRPVILLGDAASVEHGGRSATTRHRGHPAMKELVYHRILLPTVERNADRVAFVDGAYEATFAEHLDRVGRVASALRDLG